MWATAERFTPCHRSAWPFRIFLPVIASQALGWCGVSHSPVAENETHTCKIYIYLWMNSQYSSSRVWRFLFKKVCMKYSWIFKYSYHWQWQSGQSYLWKREVWAGKYGWYLHSGPSLTHEVSSVSASWLPVTAELLLGRFLIPHVWRYKT